MIPTRCSLAQFNVGTDTTYGLPRKLFFRDCGTVLFFAADTDRPENSSADASVVVAGPSRRPRSVNNHRFPDDDDDDGADVAVGTTDEPSDDGGVVVAPPLTIFAWFRRPNRKSRAFMMTLGLKGELVRARTRSNFDQGTFFKFEYAKVSPNPDVF